MLANVLRPVALPPALMGRPAPCDFFDARGTLLLRAGMPILPNAGGNAMQPGGRRLYCHAEQAARISPADPINALRHVGEALSMLDELSHTPYLLGRDEFFELTEVLHQNWRLDADACIGYVRLASFDRPSVCHALLAALLAAELASANGLPPREQLITMGAALTMNLGSLRLHDDMHARVGAPDTTTRQQLENHPTLAANLLERIGGFPEDWIEAVAQHHECVDGSGYPQGLQRVEICLGARILRIADMLAARLHGRRARRPQYWSLQHARDPYKLMAHVFAADLSRIDHTLARLLMVRLGSFPPGSIVRLNTSELAVVSRRTTPPGEMPAEVLAFLDATGKPHAQLRMRKIGPRDCRILAYAHDDLPRLPACNWAAAWGYGH